MEQNQQQRRAAAKEFLQSLDELEDILQESPTEEEETLKTDTAKTSDVSATPILDKCGTSVPSKNVVGNRGSTKQGCPHLSTERPSLIEIKAEIDLEALEDAVADIEQYLENKIK